MLAILSIIGPIASTIISLYFARYLGSKHTSHIVLTLFVVSMLSSIYLLVDTVVNNNKVYITLLNWSSTLGIDFSICIDKLNSSLLLVVVLISTLVISFSIYYMVDDSHFTQFLGLMSSFSSFMIFICISNNLVVLFIGWELIGIFSYLLIGFWTDRILTSTSSLSAMLQNKLGDTLLTIGMAFTFVQTSNLDITLINNIYNIYHNDNNNIITIIAIGYFVATIAKSAQLGLHTWLIDAMQGPTPVSSLLHAATLVVSGPILLYKTIYITTDIVSYIALIGIISSLLGGILALNQTDIKSIIAYSTMSQFGYIVSISTLLTSSISNFHITNHAMFKASLFICAGIIVHSTFDNQDNRLYGSFVNYLPITYIASLFCTMSLIAIPSTSGSISKDLIIELHYNQYTIPNNISFLIGLLVAVLTSIYSVRLLIITFISTTNSNRQIFESLHSANFYAYIPITILAMSAISLGYILQPMLIDSFGMNDSMVISELYNIGIKLLAPLGVLVGIILAMLWYSNSYILNNQIYKTIANKQYFTSLNSVGYYNYLKLASKASKLIDLGVIELIGPHGMNKLITNK